jgi:hypothetical protein
MLGVAYLIRIILQFTTILYLNLNLQFKIKNCLRQQLRNPQISGQARVGRRSGGGGGRAPIGVGDDDREDEGREQQHEATKEWDRRC